VIAECREIAAQFHATHVAPHLAAAERLDALAGRALPMVVR
jgi:hypothetical protein